MDGSHFPQPPRQNQTTPDPAPTPLPEREWGLSAPQVAAAVLTILAACELIAALP